jgi:uncharacterized protein (TIGR02646 family)
MAHQTMSPSSHSCAAYNAGMSRKELRDSLAESQNWRCCYCQIRMDGEGQDPDAPTIEHVQPLSMGGSDDWDNLVAACRRCNSDRGFQAVAFVTLGRVTLADIMPPELLRMVP